MFTYRTKQNNLSMSNLLRVLKVGEDSAIHILGFSADERDCVSHTDSLLPTVVAGLRQLHRHRMRGSVLCGTRRTVAYTLRGMIRCAVAAVINVGSSFGLYLRAAGRGV